VKSEQKLWQLVKSKTKLIRWNRIENAINSGIPDLLGSSPGSNFFTVELKVTYDNKTIRFSPHQIAWHKTNHGAKFIMILALSPSSVKLFDSSIACKPRPKVDDYRPLGVVRQVADDAQWAELEKIMLENA
jgi:hypothetical protein|tara:strand:- start:69 stop:461 length:393 start_codon:yes stop_codon:yes gene_type:complete